MILLLFWPPNQPAAPSGAFNVALAVSEIWPALNASGPADAVFWSESELYEWIDETVKRLARTAGVFVVRDTSIELAESTLAYSLPANQVSTIQADVAGKVLRPRTVQELEAFDSAWPTTVGTPKAFVQDTQGFNHIVPWPAADAGSAGKTLGLVLHVYPADVSQSYAYLRAPRVLRDYLQLAAILQARRKETRAAMPEVAAWLEQVLGGYDQLIDGYWGRAQ